MTHEPGHKKCAPFHKQFGPQYVGPSGHCKDFRLNKYLINQFRQFLLARQKRTQTKRANKARNNNNHRHNDNNSDDDGDDDDAITAEA